MTADAPIHAMPGTPHLRRWTFLILVGIVLVCGAIACFATGCALGLGHGSRSAPEVPFLLGASPFLLGLGVRVHVAARARLLGFALFEDRIELGLTPGRRSSFVIPWASVVGFRDGDSDRVHLVRRGVPEWLDLNTPWIPTFTEADRVAVLEILVRKGIPRHE